MDSKQQGCCKRTIFPTRAEQIRHKVNTKPLATSRADRTRENKDISLPVQPKEQREIYMRPQRTNHGSTPIPLWEDQHTERGPKTPNK